MQINSEEIIGKFHPHRLGFLGFYFVGILIAVLSLIFYWQGIFLGILVVALGEIMRSAETFYVLHSGIAKEYKLLSTHRKFAEYEKIQNLEVSQSILERMFGIGSIKFDTAGVDHVEVHFYHIEDPYKVEKIVREKMALK